MIADDLKTFKPFDLSTSKSLTSSNPRFSEPDDFFQNSLNSNTTNGYDFLQQHDKGYHLTTNDSGVFGQELVVGMKFADWLSLRLNVIESDDNQLLNGFNRSSYLNNQSDSDLAGYQLGVSSVLNISQNWRLGFDVGMGRVGGDLVGLYQDQLQTTRLGVGVRNKRFGATFQSDFMSNTMNDRLEQSTMDLQVDWHFTKDGTISFGARRSVNENNAATSVDNLTGTVPYIKFKHNL
ncbi:hypothetical protein OS175_03660 [Marinicella sp. S1101]|uniref:hypothetical protein n=1 Tax=Marinicella marina TaxID=2996016 RepID=UPI0022609623|nr:hypothetical protein [Marinicella marina]MCX7552965.1 hypothetical protein [Marinicella marina]MDJ1139725.1 hypothetical protein [Marinicella marina]